MSGHRTDLRFMPDTYAAEVENLPLTSHAILWGTTAFIIIAITWANIAKLDEISRANGRVIPSSQIQIVQNLEGGILTKVLVKAGDKVGKSQKLLLLDDTRFASSFREGKLTTHALEARIARLEAEIYKARQQIEEKKLQDLIARNNAADEARRNAPKTPKNISFNDPSAVAFRRQHNISDDIGAGC